MGINYDKLLRKSVRHETDRELLKEVEYNEILLIISKELIKYRDKNKLTQEDLARKLRISQVMVSKMESGKYNYTIKSLVNLWNNISTEKLNFGANLLNKILNKITNNYNYSYDSINIELSKNRIEEKFNYSEENTKKERIDVRRRYIIEDTTYKAKIAC